MPRDGSAHGPDAGALIAATADRLAANAGAFEALTDGVSDEQARWKPEPAQWSILEVVNHLVDEEVEDFRRRMETTLLHPGQAWTPIDPQGWAVSRAYNERELSPSLERFLDERARSVAWLRGLSHHDLSAAYTHPTIGAMRAGDLLASWLAHDLIHIRQITRLQYGWLQRWTATQVPPYRLDYAGPF